MPFASDKQKRLMYAAASNPAGAGGVPQSVGKKYARRSEPDADDKAGYRGKGDGDADDRGGFKKRIAAAVRASK